MARPSKDDPDGKALLDLLDKFVCVRMVYANGTDLSLFHFDHDLTFAAFILNADRKIYGRYGSLPDPRSGLSGVSQRGFSAALRGALELHAGYPDNAASFSGKRGPKSPVAVPEDFDTLSAYREDLEWSSRNVARSCMHCHQIGTAWLDYHRRRKEALPENVLFPWPMPNVVGLQLDVDHSARVQRVDTDSAAARAGLQKGDDIVELEGQAILSIADVQWVLHNVQAATRLRGALLRNGERVAFTLEVDAHFRRPKKGLPFRWTDRHLSLGRVSGLGLATTLRDLTDEERAERGLDRRGLALVAAAPGRGGGPGGRRGGGARAGLALQEGDIIVALGGIDRRMSESDVVAFCLQEQARAATIEVTLLRGGERVEVEARLR